MNAVSTRLNFCCKFINPFMYFPYVPSGRGISIKIFHLTAGEALDERIINTRSLYLNNSNAYESIFTNFRSLHLNEFGVRMHNYHSLVPSHEKRIVVGSLRNLYLTLILTAEQNIWSFQYHDKNSVGASQLREQKLKFERDWWNLQLKRLRKFIKILDGKIQV